MSEDPQPPSPDKPENAPVWRPLPYATDPVQVPLQQPLGRFTPFGDAAGSKLKQLIEQYRDHDEAKISLYRVDPEMWNGVKVGGGAFVDTVSARRFRTPEELQAHCESEYGGRVFDVRFAVPSDEGSGYRWTNRTKITIDADPKPKKQPGQPQVAAVGGTPITPDIIDRASRMQQDLISDLKEQLATKRNGSEDTKLFEIMRDLARERGASVESVMEKTLQIYRDELTSLRSQMEAKDRAASPSTDLMRWSTERVSADLQAATQRFQEREERLLKDFATERKDISDRFERQIADLRRQLDESERRFADERNRHRDELTRERDVAVRDAATVREMHGRDLEAIRRDRENDIKRVTDQLDHEKRAREDERRNYETAITTRLDGQRALYETQIAGHMQRVSMLEEKVRDMERQLREAQDIRLREMTNKPDPLTSAQQVIGTMKSFMGDFGYERHREPEDRTVQLLRAAKDTGIVDGVGGILGRIADAVKPAAPPPMPMPAYTTVPGFVGPDGRPMMAVPMVQQSPQPHVHAPSPAPAAPQPPAADPSFQPPQPHAASAPAAPAQPPPAPTPAPSPEDAQKLRGMADGLAQMMAADLPMATVAQQIKVGIPRDVLVRFLDNGVTAFQETVKQVAPDSPLVSTARGDSWLRELFGEIRKALA